MVLYIAEILTANYILEVNEKTQPAKILLVWDEKFKPRQRALQKASSVKTYLNSFPALRSSLGKILLESDFTKLSQSSKGKCYDSVMRSLWPTTANELLPKFNLAQKSKEKLKNFLQPYQSRLEIILKTPSNFSHWFKAKCKLTIHDICRSPGAT